MSQTFSVFIVDDDPIILELLEGVVSEDCLVESFESGTVCLARVTDLKPDIFLIDVSMPVMDGYGLCQRLKDDWDTQDIPVIFMSANDDIETRLLCYEAGGDDFITKPIPYSELSRKLKVARRILADKHALREQAGYAQRTAFSAMASMGELGAVLQFLSKSFVCKTIEDVGASMLEAMQQWDLQAAVQLRVGAKIHNLSLNGVDIPLEVNILNHVRNSGRIFQFKSRCVFNYGRVTLMVNNMPVEDVERCGRIRDNGALLAEGADARLKAIEHEMLANERRLGIEAALPQVQGTLEMVQDNYQRNCFQLTQVMIEFQEALMKTFVNLGLTETQEDKLTAMADAYMQRMVGTQDQNMLAISQLEELAGSLKGLLK